MNDLYQQNISQNDADDGRGSHLHSNQDQEYVTVHVMCVTLVQLFAAMFLIVSYALIIKKYVRNKVNVGES